MANTEDFQLSLDAADAYESVFVPALFEPWARILVDAAGVRPGDRVLDVACGTGIVARIAADRAGPAVPWSVSTGTRRCWRSPSVSVPIIEWREGDASGLPFLARSFDVVTAKPR